MGKSLGAMSTSAWIAGMIGDGDGLCGRLSLSGMVGGEQRGALCTGDDGEGLCGRFSLSGTVGGEQRGALFAGDDADGLCICP